MANPSNTRERVDALRRAIAEEQRAQADAIAAASSDKKEEKLLAEEQRLQAELAALRGQSVEPTPNADGYVVPMGTVAVETDVVTVTPEEATAPAKPLLPPPPAAPEELPSFGRPEEPTIPDNGPDAD